MDNETLYRLARDDFRRARRLAVINEIGARLRGKPIGLLSFEEVRRTLKASGEKQRGLQTIPLNLIVGSVGRYTDFTRDFLPRRDSDASRWVNAKTAIRSSGRIKPIQVYKIGDVYFVLDGNHRVSIARERGAREIPAYVTEIHTKVNIDAETDFDDLILKSEYTEFLEKTGLEENCPHIDLTTTVPGQYKILESQIKLLHQQFESEENIKNTFEYTAQTWCKEFYFPVIKIIRERGILQDFPNRTETDLYAWILRHQKHLQQDLGWNLEAAVVATDIADRHGSSLSQKLARMAGKIRTYLVPEMLKTGPRPGRFRTRQEKIHAHDPAHLFTHMLIPMTGEKESWQALKLGLRLAWREEAHLLGLHIIPQNADRHSETITKIKKQFKKHCQDVGLPGEMAVDRGPIVPTICKHARLCDLVIIHLAHPPDAHPIMRAGSGIRKLIQQSPRPILTVSQVPKNLERLLVAYNGNPKAREALYAAAYFAGRWEVPLYILTVAEPGKIKLQTINQARYYLRSRRIPATFIQKKGNIAKVILEVQAEHQCNLIIMGGYSKPPVIDVVMGSPLDQVLRESPVPVLICR